MDRDFQQTTWDDQLENDLGELLRLAVREDSGAAGDLTTLALVPEDAIGRAEVVFRSRGVIAGLRAAKFAAGAVEPRVRWTAVAEDRQEATIGASVARMEGPARGLLRAERLVLNLLGRLSGIATLTRQYVEAVRGTQARIYDTRKTTPGWRRLEKYAVRCGGGHNHRTGLFDAVLIKDNHLALGADPAAGNSVRYTPAEAVRRARQFLAGQTGAASGAAIVEVEVDTLEQLDEVLAAAPDIVLLDNMSPAMLAEAVARRNAAGSAAELEASGGVSLATVRPIALSGVERISVGALTHSAVCLDVGLDWVS
ncbi:MAG: carboxylating nicotinate-nucleotide diphosphorylase [Rhodopirellula sp.]|nr:carboxylating nicotinate-nucleotide diphosphorylase [Rhodopirellula sp.]